MTLQKKYLLFIIIFVSSVFKASNDTCLTISEEKWRQMSQKENYTEKYDEIKPDPKKNETSTYTKPSLDLSGFKYVFYIIVIGLILFVIIKVLMNLNSEQVSNNEGITINYTLSEVEENIMEIDLHKILQEAISNKDYRLAFRINFLIIIKLLANNGRIDWTKEKTNWEYHKEIKDPEIAKNFEEIIFVFECVWYGDNNLTETQFYNLQPSYDSFKSNLV